MKFSLCEVGKHTRVSIWVQNPEGALDIQGHFELKIDHSCKYVGMHAYLYRLGWCAHEYRLGFVFLKQGKNHVITGGLKKRRKASN